jgi:peptidoglycan/xylan/chitin deacetylase (PgdA/CDA1 family)
MPGPDAGRSHGLHASPKPCDIDRRIALFSLDVETDYGTGRTEALAHLDRFADLMADLGVPWTAFVEGHLFAACRGVCRLLRERCADVQLHCFDHGAGDTAASLRRSVDLYGEFCGRAPEGYRAHTYRLTEPLVDALIAAGFRWDSSLMRAYAQGGDRRRAHRRGDYLILRDRLVEFPMGTWRGVPLPLNHAYLMLAKTPGELLLRTVAGPPRLLVYNLHMTDLVRCGSLAVARRAPAVRLLHKYAWSTHGKDTFAVVRRFVVYLRRIGYEMLTTSDLYARVAAEAPVARTTEAAIDAAPVPAASDHRRAPAVGAPASA